MANTKKSPLQMMKDKFGGKETLVDRLIDVLGAGDDKAATKTRLLAISNAKLLRLFQVGSEIKDKFGSKEKLAQAVAEAAGKAKDSAYVARLVKMAEKTPARVLDLLKITTRRAKAEKAA